MRRIQGLYLILAIVYAASAQSIAINGTVSIKGSSKPIAGAIVKLMGQNIADTTDSQGAFSLKKGNVLSYPGPILPSTEKMSFINGIVALSLPNPAPVRIELYDLRGTLLERVLDRSVSEGNFRFDVKAHSLAANIMLIRVFIGHRASTFRYLPIDNGKHAVSSSNMVSSAGRGGLAKTAATVDTMKITASGYLSDDTAISSYQGVVNVTLDSIKLEKFSFFVTSLKSIKEFSKSANGFGGDLKFGKTGQGAGLLGADSICQCIAEKSMAGSKVKIWRAFLSVASGPDGKQVNAIDRIGKGPWYDRVGNVLSPNIQGLLATRPNADAAIKNDLPNEWGVPNHYPDPNAPSTTEDNHHMITGSDTTGKLYRSSATCEDWTSTTASGSPRCGFSWPRGGGGGGGGMMGAANWISGFDAASCKPEVHVTTSMGGSGIGSNGGYGGFYCFALNP